MGQDTKVASKSNAALMAVAQSLRQAATQPASAPVKARQTPDHFAHETPHVAPAPRLLRHGMTEPRSSAVNRAHSNAASWHREDKSAPTTFRDSPTGHAWQMTHFQDVWQHLGPSPTSAHISKARGFVAQRSKGVPAAELDAYIHDMRKGAECHQSYLVQIIDLGLLQGPMAHARAGLAQALCSELEAKLSGTHEAVRALFVQDLRKRAPQHVLKASRHS